MKNFSDYFDLKKTQAELDFVDIEVDGDMPLYIDPYAFTTEHDAWSAYCHHLVVTFFQAVLDSIKAGSKHRALSLLSRLNEPAEIHLGVSSEGSAGRGIGPTQAAQIYESLRQGKAAATGLLSDLSDFALFIPQIGRDKISDITANVVRGPLIEYTQKQCQLHDIPMQRVPSGLIWNPDERDWRQTYTNLPVCNESKVILTPKFIVRYKVGVDPGFYRQHFVLNFLQDQHLRAGDGLVTAIKNSQGKITRRVVYKKDLNKIYPNDKDFLTEFSADHPKVIEKYRSSLRAQGQRIPNVNPKGLSESALAVHLSERLRETPPGEKAADDYHELMLGVVSFLYYPHLIYPEKEVEINEGRKRIDICYTNAKRSGFFYRLSLDQDIKASTVHVECKNYTNDIANPEFDQLLARFDLVRGRFGLLLFRSNSSYTAVLRRCKDALRAGQGLVLPLDDKFILGALQRISKGERSKLDEDLELLNRQISS